MIRMYLVFSNCSGKGRLRATREREENCLLGAIKASILPLLTISISEIIPRATAKIIQIKEDLADMHLLFCWHGRLNPIAGEEKRC